MLITFLRHATAEDRSFSNNDAERALIDKGQKQVKRVAAFCQANQLLPESLYCSPLLRARQTANLLQQKLPGCPPAQTADWLDTTTTTTAVLAELTKLAERGSNDLWLVGHEPNFSTIIAYLLKTSPENLAIKKASLTRLDADLSQPMSAKLLWSLPCALMN